MNMKIRRIAGQAGISLLEVLIAMIILSMALLVLLNMAMVALDGNDWSNNTTQATQLMQQKLEEIRSTQNFTSGADTAQGMVRKWVVTDAGAHLMKAQVTIVWEDVRANQMTNTMTAFIKSDSL
jgi:Tfp pilus assembly protein PilV